MEEVKILYPDFLEDEAIYDELQNYWDKLISALAEENEVMFESYINLFDAEGNKFRDANPIRLVHD